MLQAPTDAALLRIFISSNDTYNGRLLSEVIVFKAREMELAGATAIQGKSGFGLSRHVNEPGLLISHSPPMVIEIVDAQDSIDRFLSVLDPMLGGALVTIEKVKVLRYGRASS